MRIKETICKCDICGAEMRESETGFECWPCYIVLGSNLDGTYTKRYDDVCPDCSTTIHCTIDKLKTSKAT